MSSPPAPIGENSTTKPPPHPSIPTRSSSQRHKSSSSAPFSISRPTSALPVPIEDPRPPTSKGKTKSISTPVNNMDEGPHRQIYEQGLQIRRAVVGEEYVARSLATAAENEFMRPLIQFATEAAWGTIWTRPGLEFKTRSLLNLVMLTALGKWTELGTHVRGAVRNGCSEVEIRESLLQATAYCGMPAGMEAFRVADRVLTEMKGNGEM